MEKTVRYERGKRCKQGWKKSAGLHTKESEMSRLHYRKHSERGRKWAGWWALIMPAAVAREPAATVVTSIRTDG